MLVNMIAGLRDVDRLAREAATAWYEDNAPSMGAAIAFYTVFSIAPLLIIAIAISGFFFGAEAASGQVFGQLQGLVGPDGAATLQAIVRSANQPVDGILATATGVAIMGVGATGVFAELQNAMDRIWRVSGDSYQSGFWQVLRRRVASFGLMLGVAFLLLVSLVVSASIAVLERFWHPYAGESGLLLRVMNYSGGVFIVAVLFAFLFKYLPRVSVAWPDVMIGSVVTALLFEGGKIMIGLYVNNSGVASAFGVAGTLAVLLLWVYYSAQIFLFGAELTRAYARRHGSKSQSP
jgi:membrane protein